MQEERFNELKKPHLNSVSEVLIEKNRKYGNSPLNQLVYFIKEIAQQVLLSELMIKLCNEMQKK